MFYAIASVPWFVAAAIWLHTYRISSGVAPLVLAVLSGAVAVGCALVSYAQLTA